MGVLGVVDVFGAGDTKGEEKGDEAEKLMEDTEFVIIGELNALDTGVAEENEAENKELRLLGVVGVDGREVEEMVE